MAVKRRRGSDTLKGNGDDVPKVNPCGSGTATALADLPYDIVTNIMLKLPIKSVLSCKCVCKSWHSIISDPSLAQLHFECASITALVRTSNYRRVSRTLHLLDFDEFAQKNLSSDNDSDHVPSSMGSLMKLQAKLMLPLGDSKMLLDTLLDARKRGKKRTVVASKPEDDMFDLVNSCNGLFCLWDHVKMSSRVPRQQRFRDTLLVCNPITGEYIRLPQCGNEGVRRCNHVYAGLGYLKNTKEYKVILVIPRSIGCDNGVVEIHTLGTRSWRSMKYHGPSCFALKYPTCLNGSLHWLVCNIMQVSILCFDFANETLNTFPCSSAISSFINFHTSSHMAFGELKESLYICCTYENARRLRFWTMKKYGDGQSWTEVVHFNVEDFYYAQHLHQPRVVFGGPGILIYDASRLFIYYDPQKSSCQFFEVRGTSFKLEPIFHIPSLIRLKDVVKGHNIEVLNVHSRCATFKLREDKEVLYLLRHKADMRI